MKDGRHFGSESREGRGVTLVAYTVLCHPNESQLTLENTMLYMLWPAMVYTAAKIIFHLLTPDTSISDIPLTLVCKICTEGAYILTREAIQCWSLRVQGNQVYSYSLLSKKLALCIILCLLKLSKETEKGRFYTEKVVILKKYILLRKLRHP